MRGRFRPNYLVHLQECRLLTHLYWQVNLDILTYPSIWHFEPFLSVYVPVASHYNCNFLTCLGPCLWQIRSYNGGRVIYGIMRTCKSCLSTQCNLSTQASIQTWYMYNDWKKNADTDVKWFRKCFLNLCHWFLLLNRVKKICWLHARVGSSSAEVKN